MSSPRELEVVAETAVGAPAPVRQVRPSATLARWFEEGHLVVPRGAVQVGEILGVLDPLLPAGRVRMVGTTRIPPRDPLAFVDEDAARWERAARAKL